MDNIAIVDLACQAIAAKKGERIVILDLSKVSLITDYFIICSAHSRTQTKAIADHVEEELAKANVPMHRREGYAEGRWILEDYGGVIIHVFLEEEREFYNLKDYSDARGRSIKRKILRGTLQLTNRRELI